MAGTSPRHQRPRGAFVPAARLGCDLTLTGFEDCAIGVSVLRLVLTPSERERYRVLCRDAGTAIEETAEIVEPGVSELEITGALAAETYDRGLVPIVVLVATDERVSRYRRPIPTARQLQQYALLVLRARRHGLVANVTRAVHFGATPDDPLRRQEACARVGAAFLAATQPDNTAGDVFAVGAATYAAQGYPAVEATSPGRRHRLHVA